MKKLCAKLLFFITLSSATPNPQIYANPPSESSIVELSAGTGLMTLSTIFACLACCRNQNGNRKQKAPLLCGALATCLLFFGILLFTQGLSDF